MKKIISVLLTMVMFTTFCIPIYAANINTPAEVTEAKIAAEIQSEKERIFDSVYKQLEAQDAVGLMDIYIEILTPKIEAEVLSCYGVEMTSARSTTYTLSNGGAIGYDGISDAVVLDVYYTAEQYREYQNAHTDAAEGLKSFTIKGVFSYLVEALNIKDMVSSISKWGSIFDALVSLKSWSDELAQKNVNNADGYAEIINVSAAGGTETGSTVIGWDNHPKAVVPDIAKNVNVVRTTYS